MLIPISGLLILLFFFAGFGTAFYYWIRSRVSGAGHPVKTFSTFGDTLRLLRTYRQIAPTRAWSLWPIVAYWVCLAAVFAVPLLIIFAGDPSNPARTVVRIRPEFFLIWVGVVSLFLAPWFTYRVIRKIPRLETGRRNWEHLFRDEYIRSDAYLAILGWLGLLGAFLAMLIR